MATSLLSSWTTTRDRPVPAGEFVPRLLGVASVPLLISSDASAVNKTGPPG